MNPTIKNLTMSNLETARLLHPANGRLRKPRVLVLVEGVDEVTRVTIAYAQSLVAERVRAVHIVRSPSDARRLQEAWAIGATAEVPLLLVESMESSVALALKSVIASERPDATHPVLLLVPEGGVRRSPFGRGSDHELAVAFRDADGVFVVYVDEAPM